MAIRTKGEVLAVEWECVIAILWFCREIKPTTRHALLHGKVAIVLSEVLLSTSFGWENQSHVNIYRRICLHEAWTQKICNSGVKRQLCSVDSTS